MAARKSRTIPSRATCSPPARDATCRRVPPTHSSKRRSTASPSSFDCQAREAALSSAGPRRRVAGEVGRGSIQRARRARCGLRHRALRPVARALRPPARGRRSLRAHARASAGQGGLRRAGQGRADRRTSERPSACSTRSCRRTRSSTSGRSRKSSRLPSARCVQGDTSSSRSRSSPSPATRSA